MEGNRQSQGLSKKDLIVLTVLIPMIFSAVMIGVPFYAIGRLLGWQWYTWFTLSPFLYIGWLLLTLKICARHSHRLGKDNPKPRFAKGHIGERRDRSFATVTICMYRFSFLMSLAFV